MYPTNSIDSAVRCCQGPVPSAAALGDIVPVGVRICRFCWGLEILRRRFLPYIRFLGPKASDC